MRRFSLILMMVMLVFATSSCNVLTDEHIAPRKGTRVYTTNYIKKYERTINAMFDNKWTLKSTEEKYEEHEPVCEHVDTRPEKFIEWAIEYHDGNGKLSTFVFDNRQSLSSQIETYVTHLIADYYKNNFYDVYIKDVPLAPSSYVYGFLAKMSVDRFDEDNQERVKKSDEYLEKLDTPDGTICLSKLTPANVFEMCPIYLSISVSFSNHPSDKKFFEKDTMNKIENMIEEMNRFTNTHLTAEINMGFHEIINLEDGNRNYYWTYVQGKQIFNAAGLYFERHAYDGYKGIFW